jgi:hypothetical protein
VTLEFRAEPLASAAGYRLHVTGVDGPASYRGWLMSLRDDPVTALAFSACLANLPLAAFAWECRPVVEAELDAPLQMVAIDSPALAVVFADPTPFARELGKARARDVVTFDNLGGDARLVVPTAQVTPGCYAHLATFVRGAPAAQLASFWCEVACAIEARLAGRDRPLWVSTAGLGVSWLHVRLDDKPKYYRHAPFRRVG